ncbi:MAG: HAMP domain-containing histidine kinase [Mogibacterium sp.]|nr:HAMP domain-containing histidine kinase [Mogibacterium sp.]
MDMIKRLRSKFIALALLSVLLVLVVLVGAINVLNYQDVVKESDSVLEMLADYGGNFPQQYRPQMSGKPGAGGPGAMHGDMDGDLDDDFDDDFDDDSDDDGFKDEYIDDLFEDIREHRNQNHVSQETPFESRYFTVTLSEDGSAQEVNISRIASVDEDTAIAYAAAAASSGSLENRFLDQYRCAAVPSGNGTKYLFLDCSRSLGSFRAFRRISIEVAALAFAIVALLIAYFSRRIIKPVAESYEKQRRFITDAGHEIKTPLAIINADAAVLEMEGGSNEWVEDIKTQTGRLAELTNELVYLSRMEEMQKDQTQKTDFSFSETISEIAKPFESRALIDEKQYTCDIAPDLVCHGDREAIRKLTGILLDNAFKYSEPGGTIRLTASRRGKGLQLSVYNTTTSITREDTEHLFERFYRADRSRNSETGGHGIGLSIAQAIVQAHGGKITAATQDEKSLLITVVLP